MPKKEWRRILVRGGKIKMDAVMVNQRSIKEQEKIRKEKWEKGKKKGKEK